MQYKDIEACHSDGSMLGFDSQSQHLDILHTCRPNIGLLAIVSERVPGMQSEWKLGDVANGTLPAVFMIGLLVASVVYSELTKTYNAFRLIGNALSLAGVGMPGTALNNFAFKRSAGRHQHDA